MLTEEYETGARRTRRAFDSIESARLYYALGLVGEVSEIADLVPQARYTSHLDAELELGDAMWYLAGCAAAWGLPLLYIVRQRDLSHLGGPQRGQARCNATLELVARSGQVAERVKKHYYHQTPVASLEMRDLLANVADALVVACGAWGTSLDEVAERNVQKLAMRYPGGYSHDAARARQDEA